jgi:hypothetical protein
VRWRPLLARPPARSTRNHLTSDWGEDPRRIAAQSGNGECVSRSAASGAGPHRLGRARGDSESAPPGPRFAVSPAAKAERRIAARENRLKTSSGGHQLDSQAGTSSGGGSMTSGPGLIRFAYRHRCWTRRILCWIWIGRWQFRIRYFFIIRLASSPDFVFAEIKKLRNGSFASSSATACSGLAQSIFRSVLFSSLQEFSTYTENAQSRSP